MLRSVLLVFAAILVACPSPPTQKNKAANTVIGEKIPAGTKSRDATFNGETVVQFDLDGDGSFDAVDLDGDGDVDGGDFDGDGVITDFSDLDTGAKVPSNADQEAAPASIDADFIDEVNSTPEAQVTPAASVDLSPMFPAVGNQGALGSCAAWAVSSTATYVRNVREKSSAAWASAQFLYAMALSLSQGKCDDGTFITDGLDTLVLQGAPTLDVIPYDDKQCLSAENTPALTDTHNYRLGSWAELKPFTRAKVKESIAAGWPVVFGSTLPPNFNGWSGDAASGVFKSDEGQGADKHGGGHAMVIVGYDDGRGAYRILNSWGTDWGDKGYIWWDYADFEKRSPYGYSPTPLTGEAKPFESPDAATFTMTVKGAVTFTKGNEFGLAIGITASQPVQLTKVTASVMGTPYELDVKQAVYDGYVVIPTSTAIPAGTYDVTFDGKLVNGAVVSKTVATAFDAVTDPG